MKKQREKILRHLKRAPIAQLEALRRFGCMRLSARILELRKSGLKIITEKYRTRGGAIVARYHLTS